MGFLFCFTDVFIYLCVNTTLWLCKFEIRYCEPSNFFFFLEVVLAILGDLHFHVNFKIRFFCLQTCRDFDWVCIELKDPFVENWHLSSTESYDRWSHRCIFLDFSQQWCPMYESRTAFLRFMPNCIFQVTVNVILKI